MLKYFLHTKNQRTIVIIKMKEDYQKITVLKPIFPNNKSRKLGTITIEKENTKNIMDLLM